MTNGKSALLGKSIFEAEDKNFHYIPTFALLGISLKNLKLRQMKCIIKGLTNR